MDSTNVIIILAAITAVWVMTFEYLRRPKDGNDRSVIRLHPTRRRITELECIR
jgi:hypothetical protein